MQERLTRSEVPVELTWNLDDLFPSAQAWAAELQGVEAAIPSVSQYKGQLGDSPTVLQACLDAMEALNRRFTLVATYASLRNSEDGTSPANQAASGRVASLGAKLSGALSFIRSEILALPGGQIEEWIASEPGLATLAKHLRDLLETRPHTLGAQTEQAVASLGEVLGAPYTTYNRAKSSDMSFAPITTESGEILPNSFALYEDQYEQHENTDIRRNAWASFSAGLQKYQQTFGATFATEVKKNVVMARLRGYESATHMLLHPQQVSVDVYENILNIIQTELAPHMRRYARLRKRVLGLDKLLYCDVKAPLDPEFSPQTTYEEASEVILEALSVMGPEYSNIMKRALTERWVDLADNVGKSTGAFCSSPYGSHPYILITWTDTMRSAFVLAHELGHAGHFGLANQYQRQLNVRPTMFFIEAPSTINEMLLGQHILRKSTDARMRRWVLMQYMGTYHHNFVTHLLEAELQRRIYRLAEAGKPITATTLSQNKGDILSEFWGDTVEIDEGARLTWMRQPHYYMGLYPYTYAAGLTASTTVAEMIEQEGQPVVDRWLDVLKSGGTRRPLELMQMGGVDLTKPDPIRKAVAFVGSIVDELEKSFS